MPGPVTGGIASKIFADGTALLAGTADFPGQICTSADGVSWTVARSTAAGGTHGDVVNLNDIVYFNQIRPTIVSATANAVPGFPGGAHLLTVAATPFLDNTLVLANGSGGFASVTLQKSGTGFSAYPCATFGTSGAIAASEYNGLFIATNSPDGIVDPLNIGIYQEQPGLGSHRRIYCNYSARTVTCYGYDPAGAVTGILVTDPVCWVANADGTLTIAKGATVTVGDLETATASAGVIMKSANGTRYRVTVSNAGVLTTTAL